MSEPRGAQSFPEPTVGALIFDPAGRILLLQSHKWGGRYVVPGGHLELGETLEAALHREVEEETGLAVHDVTFVLLQEFIYDPVFWRDRHFLFFDFACRSDATEVQLNDEAEAYIWADLDDALNLPIDPYTERAIRAYMAQRPWQQTAAQVSSADLELVPAQQADRPVLASLLELYLYDFSEYEASDVGADGRYGYQYLDHYWSEAGRHAFLFRVQAKLAGFALIRTIEPEPDPLYSMAEFFVMRKYRRQGVGREAARRLFDLFPGRWSVAQEAANLPAQAFWRKVIGEYTRLQYADTWHDADEPVGPRQAFRSGNSGRG